MRYLPAHLQIANRRLNFLATLADNSIYCSMFDVKHVEFWSLIYKFNIDKNKCFTDIVGKLSFNKLSYKGFLFEYFESIIDNQDI